MRAPLALAAMLALDAACTHGEPPTWDAASGSLAIATMTTSAGAVPIADAASDAAFRGDGAIATADSGIDPGALPQTRDRPAASGDPFDARVHALWDAIVEDDPDRALPFFFPRSAYEQVKAIANPDADWKRRLVAAFTRDIHALHAHLGSASSRARFVRIDVPMDRARWVEPGEEYNKLGYFRVFGSKIVYAIDPPEGSATTTARAGAIDIASLISWRGEWYCVHLSGIH